MDDGNEYEGCIHRYLPKLEETGVISEQIYFPHVPSL